MKFLLFDNTTSLRINSYFPSEERAREFISNTRVEAYVVKVEDNELPNGALDNISIILKCTNGPSEELITSGEFVIDYRHLNRLTDEDTHSLIKQWCLDQPEGCEEAFLNIGLYQSHHPRYTAYLDAKQEIISQQEAKKFSTQYTLEQAKEIRCSDIDMKTRRLIASGFAYDNRRFSLSSQNIDTWMAIYMVRADLPYPLTVSALDGNGEYKFLDADAVRAFFLTGIQVPFQYQATGRVKKSEVNALENIDDVWAYVDDRV